MTSIQFNSISNNEIDLAFRFLGPADFAARAPQGCMEHLILAINRIAIFLFRTLNLICGDHRWHNNATACALVQQYYQDPPNIESRQEIDPLRERIELLCDQLELRSNGHVSYAHGIERNPFPSYFSSI